MRFSTVPPPQGLYHPAYEHESCGIGFVVDIQGRKSRTLLDHALNVLAHLNHRGARGSEPNTGDGAGVLLQIPHAALQLLAGEAGCALPEAGAYGVGMCFLPVDADVRRQVMNLAAEVVAEFGQKLLGWRDVPTDASSLGRSTRAVQPHISQLYVGRGTGVDDDQAFERRLYVIRKVLENRIHAALPGARGQFYVASLSHRTVVYKGMLTTPQLRRFYPELDHPAMETAIALVHSRFSTNTFPSWDRAHPYRYLMHNGEINTVQGNENWMRARQELFRSELFGADLTATLPVIDPDGSDSAKLDNTFELLVLGGRSLAHAFMMLIPEPVGESREHERAEEGLLRVPRLADGELGRSRLGGVHGRHSGGSGARPQRPAAVALLRDQERSGDPGRRKSACSICHPKRSCARIGCAPGRMLLVDTSQGRIIDDAELKSAIAGAHDYAGWLRDNLVHLSDLPAGTEPPPIADADRARLQRAFGYTFEDLRMILEPMTRNAIEPIGSMGNDTPPAVLSDGPKLLYSYFKQLFAQVTNPPIDAIREELVTSTLTTLGGEGDLLHATPHSCRQLRLESPVLSLEELEQLRALDGAASTHRAVTLAMRYLVADGGPGLSTALDRLFAEADAAIAGGADILILSDRGIDTEQAPIPALLATSAVHHHLIRAGTRTQVGLVIESGEPREVHHLATLIGYGAGAICPYLAYESIDAALAEGLFPGANTAAVNGDYYTDGEGFDDPRGHTSKYNYRKALLKGIVKVLSKMGISTIQAYRGAQIFESVGISRDVVERYFTGTAARLSGIGLQQIAGETAARHLRGYAARADVNGALDGGGEYQWRSDGEHHLNNPATIHNLQQACRDGDYGKFKKYSAQVDTQQEKLATLRGLLTLRAPGDPIPLDEVEPVSAIVTRFKTGAMSYGSISKEAHETLAIAMNRIGGKSNTGEGGRGPRPLRPRRQRRLAQQRHQAGGVGAVRGDQRIPGQRPGAADQDGAGRQAGRRRPVARLQGVSLDRRGASLHPESA